MKNTISLFIIVNLVIFVKDSTPKEAAKQLSKAPQFLNSFGDNNITVVVGSTVFLDCYVEYLGEKIVSWLRHKDINLLTSGLYTYTSDVRFSSTHSPRENRWSLKLKYVKKSDEGFYECQISTIPPIHQKIYLSVFEPVTKILGAPEVYVDVESLINLTCVVGNTLQLNNDIFWKFNNEELNYDSKRGALSIVVHKEFNMTISELLMKGAKKADSGLYTCHPTFSNPATVRLQVINDNDPEAMISSGAGKINSILNKLVYLLNSLTYF